MLDPVKLKAFDIPKGSGAWTTGDSVLYALSVCAGNDPLDRSRLPYVTETPDQVAVPSMATVLATPGFWLGHPETGVVPHSVLHGEQWLDLPGPLPVSGEFASETSIIGLTDKGEGRDALLYLATEITTGGRQVAMLRRSLVLRKQGGFGAEHDIAFEAPKPRESVGEPIAVTTVATRPEQAFTYALNGDTNPLHFDPDVARKAGFDRPILHGLCTYGIAATAVVDALCGGDPARLRHIGVRFSGIVYPGETVEVSVWANGAFSARVIERETVALTNGTVLLDDE